MLVKLLPGQEWIYASRPFSKGSRPSLGIREELTDGIRNPDSAKENFLPLAFSFNSVS